MSTTISMCLGIMFLILAIVAVVLQAWLWGPKFWDEEARVTRAPLFWLRMHAFAGYTYGIIYAVMMWHMLPRLWEYQYELPARTVVHAVIAIVIGVLLVCKISILIWFRHFEESMPYYGFGILLCTVLLTTLSVPYALQAHDLGGRTSDPENIERVRKVLSEVDFGETIDADALATPQGFQRGRKVLVRQCTVCHDMRTILAKPRTPQQWQDVSERMLDKPSVFGDPLDLEDIPFVTAYLAAITPDIHTTARARHPSTPAPTAHASAPPPPMIDAATGEELLRRHCSECHEADESEVHGGDDVAGWRTVVASMIDEGAEIDDATAAQIATYLAQKYPPGGAFPLDPAGADHDGTNDTGGDINTADHPKHPTPAGRRSSPATTKARSASQTAESNGRALFAGKCTTCHGGDGRGKTSFGHKFNLGSLSGLSKTKIRSAIVNGVPGTKMKSYQGKFSKSEIDALVGFVQRL